jgi:hypothetical protein
MLSIMCQSQFSNMLTNVCKLCHFCSYSTFFAPTDAAFTPVLSMLDIASVENMTLDQQNTLLDVLDLHIIPGICLLYCPSHDHQVRPCSNSMLLLWCHQLIMLLLPTILCVCVESTMFPVKDVLRLPFLNAEFYCRHNDQQRLFPCRHHLPGQLGQYNHHCRQKVGASFYRQYDDANLALLVT